jgi:hypothetical protein
MLEDQTIFKLRLSGTQSDMLNASKLLAEKVLTNMQRNSATPHP